MKTNLVATLIALCAITARAESGAGSDAPAIEATSPGRVEIVGEGVISTSGNQTFPSQDRVTGDLWFSVYEDSFDEQSIMVSRQTESGWASPEMASFSGKWGDRAPRFSPDGSTLFITSNRPRPGMSEAGDMNVWRLERTESGWGEPQLLPSPVNSEASDIHPSVTLAGIWV